MAALVKSCGFLVCFVTFVVRCSPRLYDYSDMLLVARCQSKCAPHHHYPAKHSCLKECEESTWTKPGYCSKSMADPDPCMKTCDFDSQCPGTEKCCLGACGTICRPSIIPEILPDLPPIPSKITHHEKNNHSSIVIHWQGSREYPNIFYVIQERHHLGVQFREEKLGDWSPGFVVGKPRLKKKYVFVPGRWYQVRVAAVNMHGSRGFSPPSEAFTMSRQPKPPGVPLNLKFEAVNLVRGKYWVELHWDPPVSELPLNNYIIYWSTFLQPTDSMDHKPAPVITHHEVISPDQTHFSIPDLDPSKNLFYIRVQALSVFGTRRLKSVMADKIFSPANYTEVDTLELPVMSTSKRKKRLGVKKSLPDFKVERMFTQRQELFAKLSWSGVAEGVTDHYTVTWSSNKCDNVSRSVSTDVSANVNRSVFTASTDNHWYTIHGLKYNCKYRASVKTHHHRLLFSSSITFTTPQCTPGHPCSKVFTSTVS